MAEESGSGTYRLLIMREFDTDDAPPGSLDEKLEFAADHSGLPGETWILIDDMGREVEKHEV